MRRTYVIAFIQKGVSSSNPNQLNMIGLINTTVMPVRLKTIKIKITWNKLFNPHFCFSLSKND